MYSVFIILENANFSSAHNFRGMRIDKRFVRNLRIKLYFIFKTSREANIPCFSGEHVCPGEDNMS